MDENELIGWLRSLHDVSKAINSSLDLARVEAMILEQTSKLMTSDRVAIFLLGETRESLILHRAKGFAGAERQVKRFDKIRSFDHCIVHKGTVITMREVLSDEDIQYCQTAIPALLEMVFAPLEIQGAAFGLLGASGTVHDFSLVELEIFCSLGSQAAVAIENARLYQDLHETFLHATEALAEAVNSRDPYTGGHTRRVHEYAILIADALDMTGKEKESLGLAATLHDIGKIGIDDAILRKVTGLTDEESALMRQHPEIGARILDHVREMTDVIPAVRHHHEWFNGRGYPDGLAGEAIPLNARIIAIADAYDALTTDRPYRKRANPNQAVIQLYGSAGSQFDPTLLEAFRNALKAGEASHDTVVAR